MNELVTQQQEAGLVISTETKELIQSSIADSTLKRYQRLSKADRSMASFRKARISRFHRDSRNGTDLIGRSDICIKTHHTRRSGILPDPKC